MMLLMLDSLDTTTRNTYAWEDVCWWKKTRRTNPGAMLDRRGLNCDSVLVMDRSGLVLKAGD